MPVSHFALCTLNQVKRALRVSGSSATRDAHLIMEINQTSAQIEQFCRRRFVARDYKEDYDGSGDDTLIVDNYPVLAIQTLLDDVDRNFNSSIDVIPATDRQITQGWGKGVIRVWNDTGAFSRGKGNIRIHYHAGFANVEIEWDANEFQFTERSGGTTYTMALSPGVYDVYGLATAIQSTMSSLGLNTYLCQYNPKNRTYAVALQTGATQTLTLNFNSGQQTLPKTLGYATSANLSGATRYTCATAIVPRVAKDLEQACIDIVVERYTSSDFGRGSRGLKSQTIGAYSESFFGTPVSSETKTVLERHQKPLIF